MTEQDARDKFWKATEEWLGRFGEALWSKIFEASGISYVPLCRIETGGAPMIRGGTTKIVLPDFDLASDGETCYVDSKAKTTSVVYRKAGNQERHGIDKRNWDAYLKAGAVYRKQVGVGLLECFRDCHPKGFVWSGSLLVETFRNLGAPYAGESNQSHMIYWRRKQFVDLDSLDALRLLDISNGKIEQSYEHELRRVFLSAPVVQTMLI